MSVWLLANVPSKDRCPHCDPKAPKNRACAHSHTHTQKYAHTHRYILAIFLLIHGQTNTQTRPAQTSDSARVMRKMAHMGSISNPSTAEEEQSGGWMGTRAQMCGKQELQAGKLTGRSSVQDGERVNPDGGGVEEGQRAQPVGNRVLLEEMGLVLFSLKPCDPDIDISVVKPRC